MIFYLKKLMIITQTLIILSSFIKIISDYGYFTDQSDSWLVLRIFGENCINVLERICPLNLDSEIFLNGNYLILFKLYLTK